MGLGHHLHTEVGAVVRAQGVAEHLEQSRTVRISTWCYFIISICTS